MKIGIFPLLIVRLVIERADEKSELRLDQYLTGRLAVRLQSSMNASCRATENAIEIRGNILSRTEINILYI